MAGYYKAESKMTPLLMFNDHTRAMLYLVPFNTFMFVYY